MKDYFASIEKFRLDAAEARLIRDLASDAAKREMYDRIYEHLSRLADEIELAMTKHPPQSDAPRIDVPNNNIAT